MTEKQSSSSINFSQPLLSILPQEEMTKTQYEQIASYMERATGIKFAESKRTLIQSRLYKRLKILNLSNFEEYLNFVFSGSPKAGDEVIQMVDLLTTNLTHFFRENQHFDFLTKTALPSLVKRGIQKPEIWSAGCSSGEEPYTISIVLKEFITNNPGTFFDYSILATDLSTRILDKALTAVYPMESVSKIPLDIKKKYFLKNKNPHEQTIRVKSEIRSHVHFERLNFMAPSFSVGIKKNIIFCRNVLIYFDKPTQGQVIKKLVEHLEPGGYLFLGHSETIFGLDLPLRSVASTVFQKTQGG